VGRGGGDGASVPPMRTPQPTRAGTALRPQARVPVRQSGARRHARGARAGAAPGAEGNPRAQPQLAWQRKRATRRRATARAVGRHATQPRPRPGGPACHAGAEPCLRRASTAQAGAGNARNHGPRASTGRAAQRPCGQRASRATSRRAGNGPALSPVRRGVRRPPGQRHPAWVPSPRPRRSLRPASGAPPGPAPGLRAEPVPPQATGAGPDRRDHPRTDQPSPPGQGRVLGSPRAVTGAFGWK
jgi:hypothetical protein